MLGRVVGQLGAGTSRPLLQGDDLLAELGVATNADLKGLRCSRDDLDLVRHLAPKLTPTDPSGPVRLRHAEARPRALGTRAHRPGPAASHRTARPGRSP